MVWPSTGMGPQRAVLQPMCGVPVVPNAGIAACNVDCPYLRGCMESELPAQLDLVVMEAHGTMHGQLVRLHLSFFVPARSRRP